MGAIVFGCVLLAGCNPPRNASMRPSPEAYLHFKDRVAAQMFRWGIPWRIPCSDIGESLPSPLWEEQCFRFTKPQLMQGFWRNNFEGSQFCDRRPQCGDSGTRNLVWLEMRHPLAGSENTPPGGLYAINFVGRRSEHGIFGGQAMASQEVIVDRLVSINEIEPPLPGQMPPEMAGTIVADYFASCKGVRICMPNSVAVNWREKHRS